MTLDKALLGRFEKLLAVKSQAMTLYLILTSFASPSARSNRTNSMTIEKLIQYLESAWDNGGFLDAVRLGHFAEGDALQFLGILETASIDEETIPKRLVSLLWYLPSFLEWQKGRVAENGGDMDRYQRFVTGVHNTLEKLLGVP